jgi:hypothetical protein
MELNPSCCTVQRTAAENPETRNSRNIVVASLNFVVFIPAHPTSSTYWAFFFHMYTQGPKDWTTMSYLFKTDLAAGATTASDHNNGSAVAGTMNTSNNGKLNGGQIINFSNGNGSSSTHDNGIAEKDHRVHSSSNSSASIMGTKLYSSLKSGGSQFSV